MYLFFDTETTGLPRNWRAPLNDLDNWPRLVQLAYLLYDKDAQLIYSKNVIIRPQGFIIPTDSSRIHGITTERAISEGIALAEALSDFSNHIKKCQYLVAHNMSFDEMIVGAEFLRTSMSNFLSSKKKICTKELTTDFCAIPGNYGYKWPKLSELHYKLFKTNFDEAHDASVDIKITAKCFWELKRLGILSKTLTN
jgi:DNA polymerase III epsilon subunit-like protein